MSFSQDSLGNVLQSSSIMNSQPQSVWYCPSRWLLAHHDAQASIQTLSSHMCLADLNNDGESLLALVDFKQQPSYNLDNDSKKQPNTARPPYDCRLRVYRGQQLIYNHFLDDVPACLLVTSVTLPLRQKPMVNPRASQRHQQQQQQSLLEQQQVNQPLLTLAINDDVYFYHKLKASHRICLEDEDFILDSLNRSEVDAWRMVKQEKVDIETMRELLLSLSQEIGQHELTSHSNNFLALPDNEARRQYLVAWKYKRLQNGLGEQIMSMDTICCAAARLKFDSNVTRSGDFGLSRGGNSIGPMDPTSNLKLSKLTDVQHDGLIVGTEDRHLLIYELRSVRTRLERHARLASVPDHILVERRLPASFAESDFANIKSLSYKILVSCRNCRIYSIDVPYLSEKKSISADTIKELAALKSNVLDMCWSPTLASDSIAGQGMRSKANNQPAFIVATCDRRVYGLSSGTGQCLWSIHLETPIKCLVGLPKMQMSSSVDSSETSLIGVGSQANRIDFYTSSSGRIVDSIYFGQNDYPQAMTFGRLGREDGCLCVVTNSGHLMVFILKRTARFEHGQCLSSAASYASDSFERCQSQMVLLNRAASEPLGPLGSSPEQQAPPTKHQPSQLNLSQPPSLPSAFALTKSSNLNKGEQAIESLLQSDHDCSRVITKASLDAQLAAPQVQLAPKGRDFVDQILEQSQASRSISRKFARQLCDLRDKVKSTLKQQSSGNTYTDDSINRVSIKQVTGLGHIYRVVLSLRLNLEQSTRMETVADDSQRICILIVVTPKLDRDSNREVLISPFKFNLLRDMAQKVSSEQATKDFIEETIEFKLRTDEQPAGMEPGESDPFHLEVSVALKSADEQLPRSAIYKSIFVGSINIPTC